jgi:two-component system LytT family response regulator
MQILIVEDEEQAARRLQRILENLLPDAVIRAIIPSIAKAIEWFGNNPLPDLVFMDIQLADGISFEIFKHVQVNCPVIFTTAHENYALQAFKVNSIDYLLKPIDETEVKAAVEKLRVLQSNKGPLLDYGEVLKRIQAPANYRERFIVRLGDSIISINTADIAYFYTENKTNFLCTNVGKRYPVDFNLDQVEQMLNPKLYFRINRQFVIAYQAIEEMKAHTRARVIVKLRPPSKLDTVVAIDRAQDFKTWLGGE